MAMHYPDKQLFILSFPFLKKEERRWTKKPVAFVPFQCQPREKQPFASRIICYLHSIVVVDMLLTVSRSSVVDSPQLSILCICRYFIQFSPSFGTSIVASLDRV